jgi:hypothetical protein
LEQWISEGIFLQDTARVFIHIFRTISLKAKNGVARASLIGEVTDYSEENRAASRKNIGKTKARSFEFASGNSR